MATQIRTVRARFHDGQLALLEPLDLPEGAEVLVSIEHARAAHDCDAFSASAGGWKELMSESLAEELMAR